MGGSEKFVRQLVTELITESATAEIALWVIGVSVVVFAAAALAPWWFRQRGDPRADDLCLPLFRWMAVIAVFGVLTQQVLQSGWLTRADSPTLAWFMVHRTTAWTDAAVTVTTIGGPVGVAVVAGVVAVILAWRQHSPRPAVVLLGSLMTAGACHMWTKFAVGRDRPPASAHLISEVDFSYPSGHVAGSAALIGAMLLLYLQGSHGRLSRAVAVVGAGLSVTAVAASRLYLGVHWLTDVIGGLLLGSAVVLATAMVTHALTARAAATAQKAEANRDRYSRIDNNGEFPGDKDSARDSATSRHTAYINADNETAALDDSITSRQ